MELRPFRLERYFAAREFEAPHNLCASDCETLTVAEVLALEPDAEERLMALGLGYTESAGSPELRRAIAGLYRGIRPDEVLVTTGGEEAILVTLGGLLAPGDHVVVHTPCYQSLREIPRALGCEVSDWVARREEGWALSLADVEALIRPRTRAIVVNVPHNPTGWLMPAAMQAELVALARERGITLVSDEAYRGLERDPAHRLPAACERAESAVSLGITSKTYGLPGLRIGWVATRDHGLLQRAAAWKDYSTICSPGPSELLAAVALRSHERLRERSRSLLLQNVERAEAFFLRHTDRFEWVPPMAGPVSFPALRGEPDAEAFCDRAFFEAGVLLLPGTVFAEGSREVRVGLGRRGVAAALDRLDAWLSR